jgi:hypothetical protein
MAKQGLAPRTLVDWRGKFANNKKHHDPVVGLSRHRRVFFQTTSAHPAVLQAPSDPVQHLGFQVSILAKLPNQIFHAT